MTKKTLCPFCIGWTVLLLAILAALVIFQSGCAVVKKPIEVKAYYTIVGGKAFLDKRCTLHSAECSIGQDGKIICPSGDFCDVLNKAVGAKDLLIDSAEIYCAGPDFENGGACNPPKDKTVKNQLAEKLGAAIGNYSQVEADVRKAVH